MEKNNSRSRQYVLTVPALSDTGECSCVGDAHTCLDRGGVVSALSGYGFVGQLERGESGYLHWQIFVSNGEPIRFTTLLNRFKKVGRHPHVEVARNGYASQSYVQKDLTAVAGVEPLRSDEYVEVRKPKNAGSERVNMADLKVQVLSGARSVGEIASAENVSWAQVQLLRYVNEYSQRKMAENRPYEAPEVWYVYGKTGAGKSSFVYNQFLGNRSDLFVAADRDLWGKYAYQPAVLIDEFTDRRMDVTEFLNAFDRYHPVLPARYMDKQAAFDRAFICSNLPLNRLWRSVPDEQFNAVCRRITHYGEMVDGVFVPKSLPLRGCVVAA